MTLKLNKCILMVFVSISSFFSMSCSKENVSFQSAPVVEAAIPCGVPDKNGFITMCSCGAHEHDDTWTMEWVESTPCQNGFITDTFSQDKKCDNGSIVDIGNPKRIGRRDSCQNSEPQVCRQGLYFPGELCACAPGCADCVYMGDNCSSCPGRHDGCDSGRWELIQCTGSSSPELTYRKCTE